MPEEHKPFAAKPYVVQFFYLIMLFFTSWIVFQFLAILIVMPLFGIRGFHDLFNGFSDGTLPLNAFRFIQVFASIGAFFVPVFIFIWLRKKNFFKSLKLNKNVSIDLLLLAMILVACAGPFVLWLAEINKAMVFPEFLAGLEHKLKEMEQSAEEQIRIFLKMDTIYDLIFNLFMIGLLPAVGEEMLFRGVFQSFFRQWFKNVHIAIFCAAFLFSAIHFQFYGFLPRLVLGMLFGYLFYWSGSLWVPIFAHFLHNSLSITLLYLYQHKFTTINIDDNTPISWIFVAVSALVVAGVVVMFHHQAKIIEKEEDPEWQLHG